MKGVDYTKKRKSADRMIAKGGQSALLHHTTPSTGPAYDPGEPIPLDVPVKVVAVELLASDIDGTRIKSSDEKYLMAAGGISFEVTTDDTLIINGKSRAILKISPLKPATVTVLYTVFARA